MTRWGVRLRTRPTWRLNEAGEVELEDPSRGERVRMQPWTARVLEGIERGDAPEELFRGAAGHAQAPSERRVRHLLHSLEQVGIVAIDAPRPDAIAGWQVERELGHGGVGVAYLVARDGERAVAKLPWDFLHPMERAVEALRREAAVLRALDAPGIVRLVDLAEHEGAPALLREHVDGEPLVARFEGKPASASEAARLARSIGASMVHLNERGLVLVDYKPSNVFALADGSAKLLDVGHAAPVGATRVGGTPGFMPPELEARGAATPSCDVWGLGRLYAYMRAGRLPSPRAKADATLDGLPE
ncbi:MAG TPA: protein kinase, partial [Candidatus Thermoplasmatota archaeon]|nr:protein kinase [Candidatus Thermoplasmatota archaeon]